MLSTPDNIYLANFPVDMRKSINGLSALVLEHFDSNPTDTGSYFVFCNKARNRMKGNRSTNYVYQPLNF